MGLVDSLWDKSFSRTQTFRNIDKDKTAKIDIDEFAEVCAQLGWKLNDQQKREVFEKFDTDGSGEITMTEFFRSLEKLKFGRTSLVVE